MQEKQGAKAARASATRSALLTVARDHFGTAGYAATGTEAIVAAARVTRGALYFHFKDKRDLFRALVESVAAEIAAAITARATGRPWEALRAGCAAYLETCAHPPIRQIYLLDAPAVLGWREWREIDGRHNMVLLREGLVAAIGHVAASPDIEALTLLLSGAMNEAALAIADAADPEAARRQLLNGLQKLLDGLRRITP
jgi:AcrR family transcriptional regulator